MNITRDGAGEHLPSADWIGDAMPIGDHVARWCSRILGYLSLAAAGVWVLSLLW